MIFSHLLWISLCIITIIFIYLGVTLDNIYFAPLIITLPLSLIGLNDKFQKRHALWRNYPIISHMRWLLEDLRPYLRQYIVEDDLSGTPYNRDQRSLIYARAKGDKDVHPFGTELDVYARDYEWITQSIAPSKPIEEDLRIKIGGEQCAKPYSASVLNISAMSFGSLGAKAIEALNLGAKQGNFYHDTGEGAISPYHEKHKGDLVWEIGSGYFGCRANDGGFDAEKFKAKATSDQVKMIEIKLSQGAKPGHGGVLPAAKVTQEIADTRGVEVGKTVYSPAGHVTFSTPIELLNWAKELRNLSGGKPVGIKLCVGKPHEVFALMKAMLKTNILLDFIVVDGGEGGTGASPQEFTDHIGMPLREGLIIVRNALVGAGLKRHIKLGASGKVDSAFSIAANCAIGADWCNAARAFMFTVGCVQSMKCHTDKCPTGVATQNALRQRGLVVPDKAERVEKFHKRTIDSLKEVIAAGGFSHTEDLKPEHLYHRKDSIEIMTIDQIHPFLQDNELNEGTDHEIYKKWWDMADANSFEANSDSN